MPLRVGPLAAAGLLLLGGCATAEEAPTPPAAPTAVVPLVAEGFLTVCTSPPYRPFEFFAADGELVGLDMDMVGEVAADLGVEPSVVDSTFEAVQSGHDLDTGRCDVVASAVTITDERAARIDFSTPYFDADQGLLVPQGSAVPDLDRPEGVTIAVQRATTGEEWALGHGLRVVPFEDLGQQVAALGAGQVDAVVNDVAVLGPLVAEGYEVVANFSTGERYGIGVRKGNTALLEAVDATLHRIHEDGTYRAIYTEWVGVPPADR